MNIQKTISIARNATFEDDCEDDDDDDDGSGNDAYNERLYKALREQDVRNKSVFIDVLRKGVIVDENKISILTMPKCNSLEKNAFKRVLKDLAKMILGDGSVALSSGAELLRKIDESYNKVCDCKDSLAGQLTISATYARLLKDFCKKTIKKKEEEVYDYFRSATEKTNIDDLKEIQEGNNHVVNQLFGKPYAYLEGELKEIIPNIDDIVKETNTNTQNDTTQERTIDASDDTTQKTKY